MPTNTRVFQVYIRTTPGVLWKTLTSPDESVNYCWNTYIDSDWSVGSPIVYRMATDKESPLGIEGRVLAADPPHRLAYSIRVLHEPAMWGKPPLEITWEITQSLESCKVVLTQRDEIEENNEEFIRSVWTAVLSSLKTWLETGVPLAIPPEPHRH